MAYNTADDIIKFVREYGEKFGRQLQENEIAGFVEALQQEIGKMNYSVPKGTTVIAYTGIYNGVKSFEVADAAVEALGKQQAVYISSLPAGELLNNEKFQTVMQKLVGEDNLPKIMNGYTDGTWTTRIANGCCGFRENLLSTIGGQANALMKAMVSNGILIVNLSTD